MATPAFSTVAAIAGVLDLSLDAVWAAVDRPEERAGQVGPRRRARERTVPRASSA